VFSLGAMTYEMLTGRNPFAAATAAQTILNVIKGQTTPASATNAAVPVDLDPILTRALTPDVTQRQQSAAAFAAELRTVAAVLDVRAGEAITTTALLPIDDTPDRQAATLLAGALLAAAAAFGGIWWWLSR
jgi:serine/threonine protein kinase